MAGETLFTDARSVVSLEFVGLFVCSHAKKSSGRILMTFSGWIQNGLTWIPLTVGVDPIILLDMKNHQNPEKVS